MSEIHCEGCKKCTDGPATTGEDCVKIRECECHKGNLESGVISSEKLDELMESVDKQVGRAVKRLN